MHALTGVRGVAALWVVGYHVATQAQALALPALFENPVSGHGWLAVDLFFVLSGFMLMRVHGEEFARISVRGLKAFALQRCLRIYPLATVVLSLIVVLTWCDPHFVAAQRLAHEDRDFTLVPFLRTLFLATRWWDPDSGEWNEPVWSLSAEMVGYAAFPVLACTLGMVRGSGPALTLAIIAIATLVCLGAVNGRLYDNDIGLWSLARMGFGFGAGMALARAFRLMPRTDAAWAAPLTIGAVAMLGAACLARPLMIVAAPACAALVFGLAFERGPINAALAWRPILWLGTISFPLYLVHVAPLLWLAASPGFSKMPTAGRLGLLAAYLVFCLVIAQGLHVWVERPMHRLAHRLTSRRRHRFEPDTIAASPVAGLGPQRS